MARMALILVQWLAKRALQAEAPVTVPRIAPTYKKLTRLDESLAETTAEDELNKMHRPPGGCTDTKRCVQGSLALRRRRVRQYTEAPKFWGIVKLSQCTGR